MLLTNNKYCISTLLYSTAGVTQTASGGTATDPMQMFTSLLQAFGGQVHGAMAGQQPQTIHDVLQSLGDQFSSGQGKLLHFTSSYHYFSLL